MSPTGDDAAIPLLSPGMAALLGAMMVALGQMSLSLYAPGMPVLAAALHTDVATVQLSVTIYLIGFSLAQLVCGSLADAYGRRPVLLAFTVLYIVGAITCLTADGPYTLLTGRLIQGIGACASLALSSTMVIDLFERQTAARIMATIGAILCIAPALAPIVGAQLLLLGSWRWLFGAMASYGLVLLVMIVRFLPETLRERTPGALQLKRIAANYWALLSDFRYLRFALPVGLSMGGLFTLSTLGPFVLMSAAGFSPLQYGYLMGASTSSYFLASLLTKRLLRGYRAEQVTDLGIASLVASGVLFSAGLSIAGAGGWTVMIPMSLWTAGLAILLPGATMEAMAPFTDKAGTASALIGCLEMGAGVGGSAVAASIHNSVEAMTIMPCLISLSAAALYLSLRTAARRAAPI